MTKPFLLIFILISCIGRPDKSTNHQIQRIHGITDSLTPKTSAIYYFPVKPKPSHDDSSFRIVALDSFSNKWYSSQLYALKEPIIKYYPPKFEVYRFTWLRTFHRPISIRMDKSEETVTLTVKMSDGAGGYEPGKLILHKVVPLTVAEWNIFSSKLNEISFWNLPADPDNRHGTDGSEWILEAKQSDRYHFVHFWSPEFTKEELKFKACCEYLISLAGFTKSQLPEEDMY